ncbi:hypothetical protein [Demequina litorisediminis]|uniref:hypothetical protein n=1 Tax=Demequina litorisediminis TaxID=1849022 RepID=UPI003D66C278
MVEWGEDKAEQLAEDRLHLTLTRERGGDVDLANPDVGVREVRVIGHGPRWSDVTLDAN